MQREIFYSLQSYHLIIVQKHQSRTFLVLQESSCDDDGIIHPAISTLKVVGEDVTIFVSQSDFIRTDRGSFPDVANKSNPANLLFLLHSLASFMALLALIISIFKLNINVSPFQM